MSNRKLAKNVGIMSIAVSFSRVLGLIRDQVMANFFGTTYLNDAFNIAYNIPNLLRKLFGEGALSAAFVPIYNEVGHRQGKKAQIDFALNVLSLLTMLLLVLTFLGMVLAPIIVKVIYPGIASHTEVLAVKLCRIMFPYLFFIGLSSTFIAILNSHDKFFMTGLSSALLNIGMVGTIWVGVWMFNLSDEQKIILAAWGVLIGGFLQTVINFPFLKKLGYNFKVFINFTGEAISAVWKRFIPGMIGMGIREINLLADGLIASYLPIGSITALNMGNRLMQLPLGIFGIATGSAVLPLFSKYLHEENWEGLSESLRFATISLAYIMLPITAIMAGLGKDFIIILFQRGAFDAHAVALTYKATLCFSLGLIFYSLNQTITPIFYANKDTKTPMQIAGVMVALNIVLNVVLMQFLQLGGLALATSITAMVNYLVMIKIITKRMPRIQYSGLWIDIFKLIFISVMIYILLMTANHYWLVKGLLLLIIKSVVLSLASFVILFVLAGLLKVKYGNKIKDRLCQKFLRK